MPIYEYEPLERECFICDGHIQVIQDIQDEPLHLCPSCGLEVKKIVSRAAFTMRGAVDTEKAARRGFTTWKKASTPGVWEKVAGPGVDVIAGNPDDVKEKPSKVLDLDQPN